MPGMTNNELNERFRDLRQSETGCADEKMEDRLRIAFRARQRTLRIRSYALEIAASLAVACGLYFLLSNTGTALREKTINATPAREAQFVVLPYGQNDV